MRELHEKSRDQILSFKGILFFLFRKLLFIFILIFDFVRIMVIPNRPANTNTRSIPVFIELFEYLFALLIAGLSSASQSIVWLIEEKNLPEPILSVPEPVLHKNSPNVKANEPVMASIK